MPMRWPEWSSDPTGMGGRGTAVEAGGTGEKGVGGVEEEASFGSE